MPKHKVISSDDHVFEPPDLWTSNAEDRFKDRVPRIVRGEDGGDWWVCDGVVMGGAGGGGAQTGRRFEEPENLSNADLLENVRPGGYIPEERVKDMAIDGIDVGIVYPTVGLILFTVPDSELLTSIFSTYNDWLAEFCNAVPKRIKGIAMINIDDVRSGVMELERCAKIGLVGAMIPVYPPQSRQYDSHEYDPLWAAAQDLGVPLGLHIATNRPGTGQEFRFTVETFSPALFVNADHWVRMSLANMILTGVFERYPKLQVGSVEHELSWIPHFLDRLDYTYTQRTQNGVWYRYKEDMLPSDYFHRNVFLAFQEDALGIRDRDIIGVDNLLWGSDYPHSESTFPRSRQILEEILVECTEEEKSKITGENAARVYHLD